MKNKSSRHKDANTFKFQRFSERISNIDVDIFHKVAHENEAFDEDEVLCNFAATIEKWNVLNLTEGYGLFKRDARVFTIITLPQLVHSKEKIVQTLLEHLKKKDSLCLQPLLEIVTALAKDLGNDFYPFYGDFLAVLIDLLKTQETDRLEWTFHCLAYLFKFLWRPLIKDIPTVFTSLLPLLSDSHPEYVNNFAAESFAFIGRKVKDRKNFLKLVLKGLRKNENSLFGCGRLLFEVMNGVNGQFHSCADTLLPFLFESLGDSCYPQNELFELLQQIVQNILENINSHKTDLLWRTFNLTLNDLLTKIKDDLSISHTSNILKLIGQSIEFKNAKTVQQSGDLIKNLVVALSDEIAIFEVVKIIILLLKHVKLTQEQASMLIRKVLIVDDYHTVLYFVDNLHDYAAFEALILPTLLLLTSKNLSDDFFKSLTLLLQHKAPLVQAGSELKRWRKYPLDFGIQMGKIIEWVKNNLNANTVFILPHLKTDVSQFKEALGLKLDQLLNNGAVLDKTALFEIFITYQSLIHIDGDKKNNIINCLLPLCTDPKYVVALKIVDLYVTRNVSSLDNELLNKLHDTLAVNFNSPYRTMRLLTAHIYSLFEKTNVVPEGFAIFSICYTVESMTTSVETYRDQLQNLEKFSFDKSQMTLVKNTDYSTIPLRYLCGILYINFRLLWEPVIKIISTHAHGLETNQFWDVFLQILNEANEMKFSTLVETKEVTPFTNLTIMYEKSNLIEDKVDNVNFRLLLWKSVDSFSEIVEVKNRDVIEMFLKFITEEYSSSNSDMALKWNIMENHVKGQIDESPSVEASQEDEPMEIDEEEIEKSFNFGEETVADGKRMLGNKDKLKLLLQFLSVLSKVSKPRELHRQSELYKLYFDFLSHRNEQVQKAALDCLLTYKERFLVPYKENLYRLIDDKNFRHELVTFDVNKESSVVLAVHRVNLMPVVMKILGSKMTAKIGLRTGGKGNGQQRRNLIFRFLAGCEEKEMCDFVRMSFKYYERFVKFDLNQLIDSVKLDEFIPPKRLMSSCNLLNVVINHFGSLMSEEILRLLLKVLLVIGAFIKVAYNGKIHAGYNAILRNLRSLTLKILEKFFSNFETFQWKKSEINEIFTVFINPYLPKLNIEGVYSPTALLNVFSVWSKNPKYFSLLVKHDASESYPLKEVIKLLNNEKAHTSVQTAIFEMLEKLCSLSDDSNKIEADGIQPINESTLLRTKVTEINYGSCILLPHVTEILTKIKMKLFSGKNLPRTELFILSRISELAWEAKMSDEILNLLLPVTYKRSCGNMSEDVTLQILTTIFNLIKNIAEPQKHLRFIAPLFATIVPPSARKILIEILRNINNKSDLIARLNSYDIKWIDQPDFEKRLSAFNEINEVLNGGETLFDLDTTTLIIYNAFHIKTNEKDLSLRDNASHTLQKIGIYAAKNFSSSYVIEETLFALIHRNLKSKQYEVRNECISLLGALARECPETHPIFAALNILTNKVDLEVDFFENLVHLQIHRHGRALTKFCQHFASIESINVRALTQFLLPLTSYYLCKESFANKNSLVDSSIDALATICRLLPWHQYMNVLKFYLNKLRHKGEFQKQLVKIVVKVLDAFHFDLSKGNVEYIKEVQEETKEIESEEIENDEDLDLGEIEGNEMEVDTMKLTLLCKSDAIKVTKTIKVILLPQLHRAMAEMKILEGTHKVNRKQTASEKEDEDLLRVPISLAVVKLLQRLPKVILDANLPGVFIKLCTFLKSQLESVRRTARETLQTIMGSLGADYLGVLLDAIAPLLARGFQSHVLVYTMHGVLNSLRDQYKCGDIDKILLAVLPLCEADLFGTLSEEKEVAKIISKTSEAKTTKSYDTYQILAQYITDRCIMDLLLPIKRVVTSSHSFKTINKAQDSLRHITLGLLDNTFISVDSLLTFTYGVASESIPQLLNKPKPVLSEKQRLKAERENPDCFIIQKTPVGRTSAVNPAKHSDRTNAHVLIEFGLRTCYFILKRDKIPEGEVPALIDPFVSIFLNCIGSKHIKIATVTLQCLQSTFKHEMPTMVENIKTFTDKIFEILHKYAAAGLSKGDNFDLVVAAFKTMAILVRDVKYYEMDENQLKVLLLYVEQDLYDHDRQATAFALLKAIIGRKLSMSEVHQVMSKVAELSITSEMPHVRTQCRQVFHQYLMDYPLGKKLDKHVSFYLAQLNYEYQTGRESALDMVQGLISSLPINVLTELSGTFFITLGARLVNEEEPKCRKTAGDCLTSLLKKLPGNERDTLFDIVLSWFKEKKVAHKRLAAQFCGIFITVEKNDFQARLEQLCPIINLQFGINDETSAGKFVLLTDENENEKQERLKDHHLYQVLQMLLKLCGSVPDFLKRSEIEILSNHVQTLLGHPHAWVRLSAAQFLGFVLSKIDLNNPNGYLKELTEVRSLALDLCAQLAPGLKPELAEQVIKNLVFIARLLEKNHDSDTNLLWLIKRLRRVINIEVSTSNANTLRLEIFKWTAGIFTLLELETIKPLLTYLFPPLVREMITTEESNAPLRQLSKEVATMVKKKIGLEEYTALISKVEQHLSVKRAERKRTRNQMAVTDPELYAKKKIKLNEKKKIAKKLKRGKIKKKN